MARYLSWLPIHDESNFVTLGEGGTPVVRLTETGRALGIESLYGKLELCNPTGSFKDRGNAVQVTVLREAGVRVAADVTISNAGQSFAAYCARAGIQCVGFVGTDVPDQKTRAIALHGTVLHHVPGDRTDRFEAAAAFCRDHGILFVNYGENCYFIEGQKTMAYELVEQVQPLPEHILVPAGNGSIILGLWRGFHDMLADGRINRIPRLYAVQTEETQPIVAAFQGRPWQSAKKPPVSSATGIGISNPPRLGAVVNAVRQSRGRAVAVQEDDILHWQRRLAELDGILIEPTSATVLAAAATLGRAGVIRAGESVALPLTGSGIKQTLPLPLSHPTEYGDVL